jgi:peptide deformylase
MIRPILVVGNPVLRQKAKRVTQVDRSIQRLIDDMIETMKAAPGVGLAAPQVGVPLRLAVIEVDDTLTVLINPEIVKSSGETELDEGCLSVPGFWGRLHRAERVSVKALDRHGKELRIRDAEGLFAQALQHEIDHLDGILFTDRLTGLHTLRRAEEHEAELEAVQA